MSARTVTTVERELAEVTETLRQARIAWDFAGHACAIAAVHSHGNHGGHVPTIRIIAYQDASAAVAALHQAQDRLALELDRLRKAAHLQSLPGLQLAQGDQQ